MKISAIVITRNEEKMLPGCLKSLNWLDEIIVVDSSSEDKTVSIAHNFKAKTINIPFGSSYSISRNKGKQAASGDWLLYIDADERVSKELKEEILSTIDKQLKFNSFYIPRKNIMLGGWVKYGGFWPDYVHRLFHKDSLIKWTGTLHESPTVKGKVGKLSNSLTHFTARSITQALEKSAKWSQVEAKLNYDAHAPKVTWWRMIKAFVCKFFYLYIWQKGILDGTRGLILAYIQSFHDLSIMVNLWQLQSSKASFSSNRL